MTYNKLVASLIFILFSLNGVWAQKPTKKIQNYFPTEERIKSEYHVLLEDTTVFHGSFTEYYDGERVKITGVYDHSVPVGKWTYFYENGARKMEAFIDTGSNTYWKYYYENDTIQMEGFLNEEGRDGYWTYYDEAGNEKIRGKFENGKKVGFWEYYFPDGKQMGYAEYENGQAVYHEFYYEGGLKKEGPTDDNYSTGLWKYYYRDSTLSAKGYKHKGSKDGIWTYFHPNGEVKSTGKYENGEQVGEWTYYHANGEVSSKGNIVDGNRDGTWKLYNDVGDLIGSAEYVMGDGEYREYYDNGQIRVEGKIKNNVNDGRWNYYYEDGTLEGQCDFYEGSGEYQGFYKNGELRMVGKIENGEKVGIWTLYNQDGDVAGYYKTILSQRDTSYRSLDHIETDVIQPKPKPVSSLPSYHPPRRAPWWTKIRYFDAKENEFRGIIIGTNPLALSYAQLPIALEYYFEDRLGYEVVGTLRNSPFFIPIKELENDVLWSRGYSVEFKQKLYTPTKGFGHIYFGQLAGYMYTNHGASTIDTSVVSNHPVDLSGRSHDVYWMPIIGNRLGRYPTHKSFTFDIFLGIGIGYRDYTQNFDKENQQFAAVFDEVKTKKWYVPLRFGFTFGYIF